MTVLADTPEDFTLEAFRRVTVDREGVIIGSAAVRPLASTSSGIPATDGLACTGLTLATRPAPHPDPSPGGSSARPSVMAKPISCS